MSYNGMKKFVELSFNHNVFCEYLMGKLSRNLRICGDCGIAYTSVSFTKYIDQCPICKSRRFEPIPLKIDDKEEST